MKFLVSTVVLISFGLLCSGIPVEDNEDSNRQVRQTLRENILRQRQSNPSVPSLYHQLNVDFPGGPVAAPETRQFTIAHSRPNLPLPIVRSNIHEQPIATETVSPLVHEVHVEEPITPVAPLPAVRSPHTPKILSSRRQHIPLPQQHIVEQEEVEEAEEQEIISEKRRRLPIAKQSSIDKEELRRFNEEQAKSAHYSFDSSISDSINDHSISRAETRDGLLLKGMYSYSDGFFKRTVFYEADENGYRVVKEEIEPIGDGPQFNPKGRADVSSSLSGSYSITADDFVRDQRHKNEDDSKIRIDQRLRV